jgi:hypothetical protein
MKRDIEERLSKIKYVYNEVNSVVKGLKDIPY